MLGRKLVVEVYIKDSNPDASLAKSGGLALQELGGALLREVNDFDYVVSNVPVFEASTATVIHYEVEQSTRLIILQQRIEVLFWRCGVYRRRLRSFFGKLRRGEL